MADPRIKQFQELIEAMERGEFQISGDIKGNDDIGRLGESLLRLSRSIDQKFQYHLKMLEFANKLSEGLFVNDVLDYVYASFHELIPYNRIGFALLEKEGQVLRAHWVKSDVPGIALKVGFSQPMKGSSLEQIIQTGKPRIINELEQYLVDKPESVSTRLALADGVRSSLTCPLVAMGKPVGFLFFSSTEKNKYADIHQGIFRSLANQLSSVVEKSKLYEELYELNKELKASRDAFQLQATHDSLTGLWNRGAILELLSKELARASRQEKGMALLMMDIDHFKQINDNYGHLAGDEVLRQTARLFVSVARREDSVGRYGGEEFIVVYSDLDRAEMELVAERYRRVIADTLIAIPGFELRVTVSLGLGWVEDAKHVSNEEIIKLADGALYAAKNAGRNQLQVCSKLR